MYFAYDSYNNNNNNNTTDCVFNLQQKMWPTLLMMFQFTTFQLQFLNQKQEIQA